MMSVLGGGPPKVDDRTDKLRECDSGKGREGVRKSENFADVICTCPLTAAADEHLVSAAPRRIMPPPRALLIF